MNAKTEKLREAILDDDLVIRSSWTTLIDMKTNKAEDMRVLTIYLGRKKVTDLVVDDLGDVFRMFAAIVSEEPQLKA